MQTQTHLDVRGGFDGQIAAGLMPPGGWESAGLSPDARRDPTSAMLDEPASGPVVVRIEPSTIGWKPVLATLDPGESLEIGSGSAVDARVDDPTVSARHCRVEHTGRGIVITDLGAKNGIRVAGVRVDRAVLPVGGACELGRAWLRIAPGRQPADGFAHVPPLPGLIGDSPSMRAFAASARRFSGLRLPVLLRGESGTGKDLVAKAIHDESGQSGKPFVAINAATISRELAESELFGHRRGAFTGAVRDRRGAFREANGGTLFLDEIGSVPLEVQAKLLRVVEDGIVRPLGAEAGAEIDVRLVAATCEPLEAMVASRMFRADLYERLAVCVLQVPPLRDRLEDLPALARHLLMSSELGARELSAGAVAVLRGQRWAGNVRELRNVVVQAAVRSGPVIHAEQVACVLAERMSARRRMAPGEALQIFEEAGRNVSEAARRAEIPRSTMRDLLRAAGVSPWPVGRRG